MPQAIDAHGKPYKRSLLILVLLIGTFCTVLNQTILTTAFPTLMDAFDISTSTVQWLTTGFLMVNGIMIPISAWLTSRVPSKRLYLSAMAVFLIGTILCYTAPTFQVLLAGRLIQALGVGVTMPLLQTLMLTIFPANQRGSAMGLAGLVIGVAPAIGPTLSGWIIDNYHWRTLFGMIIPIVFIVLIAGLLFMKDVLETDKKKLDWISAALSTIGFGSLLFGFSEVGDKGWGDAVVITTLIVGVIFVILFGIRQLRLEKPFLDLRVLKIPEFSISATLSSVSMIAMVGAEMVLPLYIQTVRGESAFHSGLTLLPGALMMGFLSPITGRLFDKIGARRLAITGMFLLTAGTLPFAFITKTTPMIYIIVLYAVRMAGIAMAMMPVTTAGMNSLPFEKMGHGTAVNNTLRQVASSVGTAILVSVLTNVTKNQMPGKHLLSAQPLAYKDQAFDATVAGYHATFWIAIGFSALGLIIAFFVSRKAGSTAKVQPQAGGNK
ncbi:MDR family MFS transporter [Pediococcus pentosaceus]|jgi:drug resistance transporter, EmrB/QacA subfamily|uniref:DHA2 family efflux MFS transporter permease subunit n=3 Tax=Pediococcus pentosaceus TaxID=1255 RepID=A0A0R2H9E0_PEDPE|nr:MDR family MFS transporter [Pediococcus pentosaceus]ABJ68616.1 permease of the major facilitator superfamily [Pediococcus pentosaceus ATCC 25745]ANI97378.1 multidrug transporter [Pediococcus pentosaceus]AVL02043.1 MFS transporter [Pediococcus pentosaceus]AXR44047.1 MFS transporter [Pediococcus pentosaceus]KAF0351846.1 DHA2 family efflux MFS transporter permease subunit [Pediococcus pentosaceus]